MRRRLGFWLDQVGWIVGDAVFLALVALLLPLVPVSKALGFGRHADGIG